MPGSYQEHKVIVRFAIINEATNQVKSMASTLLRSFGGIGKDMASSLAIGIKAWQEFGFDVGAIVAGVTLSLRLLVRGVSWAIGQIISLWKSAIKFQFEVAKSMASAMVSIGASILSLVYKMSPIGMVIEGFKKLYNAAVDILGKIPDFIMNTLSTLSAFIMRDIIGGIFSLFTGACRGIYDAIVAIAEGAMGIFVKATTGFVNVLKESVEVGIQFSKSIILAAVASKSTYQTMSDISTSLSDVGYGGVEAAKGLDTLIRAGMETEQVKAVFADIMAFAKAVGTSVDSAANLITGAVFAFGLNAEETKKAIKDIGYVILRTRYNFDTFSVSFAYASAAAAGFNISIQETLALTAELYQRGLRASTVGTMIREMLTRLAKPTKEASKTMFSFGITEDMVNLEKHRITDILKYFKSMANDPGAFTTMFGRRNAAAWKPIIENYGKIKAFMDDMQKSDDLSGVALQERLDRVIGKLDVVKAKTENVLLHIFSIFEKVLSPVLSSIISVLTVFEVTVRALAKGIDTFAEIYKKSHGGKEMSALQGTAVIAKQGLNVANVLGGAALSTVGMGEGGFVQRKINDVLDMAFNGVDAGVSMFGPMGIPWFKAKGKDLDKLKIPGVKGSPLDTFTEGQADIGFGSTVLFNLKAFGDVLKEMSLALVKNDMAEKLAKSAKELEEEFKKLEDAMQGARVSGRLRGVTTDAAKSMYSAIKSDDLGAVMKERMKLVEMFGKDMAQSIYTFAVGRSATAGQKNPEVPTKEINAINAAEKIAQEKLGIFYGLTLEKSKELAESILQLALIDKDIPGTMVSQATNKIREIILSDFGQDMKDMVSKELGIGVGELSPAILKLLKGLSDDADISAAMKVLGEHISTGILYGITPDQLKREISKQKDVTAAISEYSKFNQYMAQSPDSKWGGRSRLSMMPAAERDKMQERMQGQSRRGEIKALRQSESLYKEYINNVIEYQKQRLQPLVDFYNTVTSSIASSIVSSSFKFKEAFKKAIDEMKAKLLELLVIKPILGAVFSAFLGPLAGMLGGSGASSILMSMFGMGMGRPPTVGAMAGEGQALSMAAGQQTDIANSMFSFNAHGTSLSGAIGPSGVDRIASRLTRGEIVFDNSASDTFRAMVSRGGMGQNVNIEFNISAMDSKDVERVTKDKIIPAISRSISRNSNLATNVANRSTRGIRKRTR